MGVHDIWVRLLYCPRYRSSFAFEEVNSLLPRARPTGNNPYRETICSGPVFGFDDVCAGSNDGDLMSASKIRTDEMARHWEGISVRLERL